MYGNVTKERLYETDTCFWLTVLRYGTFFGELPWKTLHSLKVLCVNLKIDVENYAYHCANMVNDPVSNFKKKLIHLYNLYTVSS